jgi:hypothetical protein
MFAAVATPAGIKGQKNRIADLNGCIAHLVANATHDTRSLVAKDGWIVADVSEESLLQQDILSQSPDQPGLFLLEHGAEPYDRCQRTSFRRGIHRREAH